MSRQTIFLFIIIAAAGITVYLWYSNTNKANTQTTRSSVTSEFETELQELRRLKTLKLDTSILEDPFFKTLTSPSTTPIHTPPGRKNPFVPF